jgi:hypothetical protein
MTGNSGIAPKLLLDENIWQGLAEALRQQGFDAIHVSEVKRKGLDDESLLIYATENERAILTFNARHFEPLAKKWFLEQREHAGIIISDELSLGELLRRTVNLLQAHKGKEIKNIVHWLQAYK